MKKGSHCSEEQKKKISNKLSGANNHFFEKKRPDHSKMMSGVGNPMYDVHRYGKDAPGYGKHPSEETILKQIESHKGQHSSPLTEFKSGENHPQWKGGKKMASERKTSKRRELGNNFLNKSNIGLVGHHININDIIHVPKTINNFCYHNVRTGKNMGIINYLSLLWLITSGEINNCKEV